MSAIKFSGDLKQEPNKCPDCGDKVRANSLKCHKCGCMLQTPEWLKNAFEICELRMEVGRPCYNCLMYMPEDYKRLKEGERPKGFRHSLYKKCPLNQPKLPKWLREYIKERRS
jgi:hypothetical protein